MSPTPRAALVLGAIALTALVLPLGLVGLAAAALAAAVLVDAASVRPPPRVSRNLPPVISRGVPVPLAISATADAAGRMQIRQPLPAELTVSPAEGEGSLDSRLVAGVRGRHVLPPLGIRAVGRLGLGAWYHQGGGEQETRVYPDLVSARRLMLAAREGRLLDSAHRSWGPLGLGTDFDSVREWQPDDDVRHISWAATQRLGRPMTNRYRLEQARDLIFLIDTGRLMAAPVGDRSRLDAALDAVTAVGLVADELGDHCGATAFDADVRGRLAPRRQGARHIVHSFFDLEPRLVDSDYERAFRTAARGKRSLVFVLSDLFDEAAASALIEAVPVLSRRHAVIVATVIDPDLLSLLGPPSSVQDVMAAAVALDLMQSRTAAAARLRRAGARVTEAEPDRFAAACVRSYLAVKSSLRL